MGEEQVQRRLAAILAADIVGYSRLMAEDEVGTLATLRAMRRDVLTPLVSQFSGRIVKVMGDGVLVEFLIEFGKLCLESGNAQWRVSLEQSRHPVAYFLQSSS